MSATAAPLAARSTADTDDGVLIRRHAVVPLSEDSYKAYDIVETLQGLVDLTGMLEGEGEENGDMWRLLVRDGKAVSRLAQRTERLDRSNL